MAFTVTRIPFGWQVESRLPFKTERERFVLSDEGKCFHSCSDDGTTFGAAVELAVVPPVVAEEVERASLREAGGDWAATPDPLSAHFPGVQVVEEKMDTRAKTELPPLTDASVREIMDCHIPQSSEHRAAAELLARRANSNNLLPIAMILNCPSCGERHVDEGPWATKPHHTHACQHCGMVWRPAVVHTVGVRFLPGFKND